MSSQISLSIMLKLSTWRYSQELPWQHFIQAYDE